MGDGKWECGKRECGNRKGTTSIWTGPTVVTWVTGLAGYEAVSCMLDACRHTWGDLKSASVSGSVSLGGGW